MPRREPVEARAYRPRGMPDSRRGKTPLFSEPMQDGVDSVITIQAERRALDEGLAQAMASGERRAQGFFVAAAALSIASLLVSAEWGREGAFEQLFEGICALYSGVGLAYLHQRLRRQASVEAERARLGEQMRAALSPRR